jgi:beta-glucanase (GH16 family)
MTRFLSTAFILFIFTTASFAQPLHPCAEMVWHDEFDGTTLDATKWTPQLGDGCDINLCGWGNNELQYYTDRTENVKTESGNLVITALKETYNGRDYTSARIRSLQKGDFTFGRIEARIKVPEGLGSWPAFWMLSTDETYGPWPKSGEIDIMEFQGKTPDMISGTVHYGGTPTHIYKGLPYYLPSGQFYYDDFHVFTIDWDSTAIKFYMDGNLYHTFTKSNSLPYKWPFDQRFHIILNNAIGGDLGGPVDDTKMPQTMLVDYVRVYSSPGNFKIIGNQQLFVNTTNETYYVPSVPGATDYQWTVPSGATITSGQGTNEIKVDWAGTSSAGNVSLTVIESCGSFDLSLPVRLTDDATCALVFDNMDGITNVNYDSWTATNFYTSYNNPNKTAGNNSSAKVGYLIKNSLNGTNQFVLGQVPVTDFSVYESGSRVFTIDVYTSAAPGTTVEMRFLSKSKAQGTYPAGVRTVLRAKTSLLKTWETLVFKFDHIEDISTLINEVNQIAIVFNPENTLINKYFAFDNLQRGLLPYNPINGDLIIENCDVVNSIYNVTHSSSSTYLWTVPVGFTINSGQNTNEISVNWSGLPSGRFYVKETTAGCSFYTGSLDVKVATCTGILDGKSIQSLTIFPNPSKDQLTVTCDLPSPTDVKLIISSALGEMLVTKTYNGQSGTFNEQFSIQELKPGSYIIQLVTGSDIRASQLIKY